MRPNALGYVLATASLLVLSTPAYSKSPERMMAKVRYERYTGPQRDWPRSNPPVVASKLTRDMPFFNKLPDRPYEVLGVMSDKGDMAVKHVTQAAPLVGADALLVINDKAFADAGIRFEAVLLDHQDVPDPQGPSHTYHLEHPEALKMRGQPVTIRVTQVEALLIRWKDR